VAVVASLLVVDNLRASGVRPTRVPRIRLRSRPVVGVEVAVVASLLASGGRLTLARRLPLRSRPVVGVAAVAVVDNLRASGVRPTRAQRPRLHSLLVAGVAVDKVVDLSIPAIRRRGPKCRVVAVDSLLARPTCPRVAGSSSRCLKERVHRLRRKVRRKTTHLTPCGSGRAR
jgi:hypothetical protein